MNRFIHILLILFGYFIGLSAQSEEIYYRLSEPTVVRPLTLYRGQLQFNTLLHHQTGNSLYDREGSKLPFNESARNYLANNFHFELGYGIMDFLDLTASIALYNEIETLPTYYILNMETGGEYNTLYHTKGLDNLDLLIRIRQPFLPTGLDFALSGGFSFPIFSQDPQQPEHTIHLYDPTDPGGSFTLNYLYRPRPDYNTIFYTAGGEVKYRDEKYSLYLGGSWQAPVREEATTIWNHRLYGDQFLYRTETAQRMPAGTLQLEAMTAIQFYPWFACIGSFRHHSESGGWSEETGSRISLPGVALGSISPGFEIQVTTHIRFLQFFDIPLYGKENYAVFSIRSGLSINVVPLKGFYY